MPPSPELTTGDIVWMSPDSTIGREQSGRRPVVLVSSPRSLDVVGTLALIVPITSQDRGWPNHVPLLGLPAPSWAMAEQVRAVSRERLHTRIGVADDLAMHHIRIWLRLYLDL